MSLYDKGSKTILDYEREFYDFTKEEKETVATYYLRLLTTARYANISDRSKIKAV